MKTALLPLILLYIMSSPLMAQNPFGSITSEELSMQTYAPDPSVEAVILLDMGKSYFQRGDAGFDIIFERRTRIKVLSEAGIDMANVEVPFYREGNRGEKVYEVEGLTYNLENGVRKVTKLIPGQAFTEKVNSNWSLRKFAMPDVKVGSVIEYRYRISTPYIFNLRDWEFQNRVPTVYSEYEVRLIPFYEYSWILQGASKFSRQKSYKGSGVERQFGSITYNDMIHEYVMENLPAFKDEVFITSRNDYVIKLDFQLARINRPDGSKKNIMTTWPQVIDDLLKKDDMGQFVKKCEKATEDLLPVKELMALPEAERFDRVLDEVKRRFVWNNRNGLTASQRLKDLLKLKEGNAADLNLLTIGLLRGVGLKADPVIISTRSHGRLRSDYPFLNMFNYVVILAKLDGTQVLSDATDIACKNQRIPARCINDKGLIIRKGEPQFIGLQFFLPTIDQTNFSIIFGEEEMTASIQQTSTEYSAASLRGRIADDADRALSYLENKGYQVMDSTLKVLQHADRTKPFILSFQAQSAPEIINDKLYITPFMEEAIEENPLEAKSRTYTMDMIYPRQHILKAMISIPAGYEVSFLPAETEVDNDLYRLRYTAENSGGVVMVDMEYYLKKPLYSAMNYRAIQQFFDKVVQKSNEKIALAKVTE